jgi:hypothetical protein
LDLSLRLSLNTLLHLRLRTLIDLRLDTIGSIRRRRSASTPTATGALGRCIV